jgi:hypothetical protein
VDIPLLCLNNGELKLANQRSRLGRILEEGPRSIYAHIRQREFNSARFESLGRQPASHRLGKSAGGILGGSEDFFELAALQSRKGGISFQLGVMLGQKSI